MNTLKLSLIALSALGLVACGPAETETTTTSMHEQDSEGGEVRHSTRETTETESDGEQTTERVERTETTTPASE
ncbi:MAG: hypothetical protein IPG17_07515 [Sandaracinaceae bacterium]|nr:hypothetical protein [Sandaracinaceae bacterium]